MQTVKQGESSKASQARRYVARAMLIFAYSRSALAAVAETCLTLPRARVRLRTLHFRSQEVDHATDCTTRLLRPLRSQRLASRP